MADLTDKQRNCVADATMAAPQGAAISVEPYPQGLWQLVVAWEDGPTLDEVADRLGNCRPIGEDGRRRWKIALGHRYGSAELAWLRDGDFVHVYVALRRSQSALGAARERLARARPDGGPLDAAELEVAAALAAGSRLDTAAAVAAARLLCGVQESALHR